MTDEDYVKLFNERYSTALLADAAYRADVRVAILPANLKPLAQRHRLAGPVVTVEANNDLVAILTAVHRADPGSVMAITNQTQDVAVIGDLIGVEAMRKGLAGFVVNGLVRDVTTLIDIGLSVFCRGSLPVGPLKLARSEKGVGQAGVTITIGEVQVKPGDWLFGDADGVLVLPADMLSTVFEQAAVSWEREEELSKLIRSGHALGDLLAIEAFLTQREEDPSADFNSHLAGLGRAI